MKASDCKANLPVYLLTDLRKGKLVGDAGFDGAGRELAIVEWLDDNTVQKVTYRSLLTKEEVHARGVTIAPAPIKPAVKTIAEQVKARTPAKPKAKAQAKKATVVKAGKPAPVDPRQTTIGDLIKSKLNPFPPGTRVAPKCVNAAEAGAVSRGTVVSEVPNSQLLVVEWANGILEKRDGEYLMLESELETLLSTFEDEYDKVSKVCVQKLETAHELILEAARLANKHRFDLEDMYDIASLAHDIGWSSSRC